MSFDIANFVSPAALQVLKTAGLHKVAGAMAGIDELTVKAAVAMIGAKAHMRRVEGQKIAEGLAALSALNGEKNAAPDPSLWRALLPRAVGPGLVGAGIAAAPDLLRDGPVDEDALLQHALLGGTIGGLSGMGAGMNRALRLNPQLEAPMAEAVQRAHP